MLEIDINEEEYIEGVNVVELTYSINAASVVGFAVVNPVIVKFPPKHP